jgi:superfamily I DNA/RNA helicase
MLNEHQRRAVETTQGRVLVLAGAGSGKTGVITHRIAHLIQSKSVLPTSILGLTFTNKAAGEMRTRVEGLIGKALAKGVTLSTFHSFCMQVLRKEIEHLGYTKEFSLYDERDIHRIVSQLARDILGHEGELPSLGPTLVALQQAANEGVSAEGAESKTWHDEFSKDLYVRLQRTLRAYNAVSFDHLITLTIRLFEEHPLILEKYQERFRYLMIDEYQDTNAAQSRLAELLAKKHGNFCVVGDDDQSIYGWRGANVKNILQFRADAVVKLEQNYRSTPLILEAANGLIAHNKERHQKALWSSAPQGELIEVFHAPTDADEANAVVQRILHLKEQGYAWKEMAILYRSNALSRGFELALTQAAWQSKDQWLRGIPYEVFGGLAFAERSEIKDLMAYLRFIANPLDHEALLRIINVPRRGISDTLLDALTQQNRSSERPLWDILNEIASGAHAVTGHPKGVQGIRTFTTLIHQATKRFSSGSLADALQWLMQTINYKKAIEEEVKSEAMRAFKWENVEECVNVLASYQEATPPADVSLQHFIANTTLGQETFIPQSSRSNTDKVQLMTLHSAKGLEFPVVFIAGVEDHIIPHEKGAQETGIEEERRLFYVGITRARKKLTLSMARSRLRMGKAFPTTPSRFLFEIPKHLLKMATHKQIG